jgi:hypothetical protein
MTDEERVRGLLAQAFELDPPGSARPDALRVRAAHRRRRVSGSAGVAGVVTAVVVGVLVLPALGSPTAGRVEAPSAVPSSRAPAGLPPIVRDGDLVGATGRVASVPGHPVRFCAPVPEAAVGYAAGQEPAPAGCALGVDVTGVDLGELSRRREKNGAVEGWAYLRGVYRQGTVSVTLQAGERALPNDWHAWDTPPCPTSAGGGAKIAANGNPDMSRVDAFSRAHPGELTSTVIMRPTTTSFVVVLAAEHPALVHEALGPNAAGLCVLETRFSSTLLARAQAAIGAMPQGSGIYIYGRDTGEDGQTAFAVSAVMVTPALHALAAGLPAGLVQFRPWLAQVSANAPLPPPMPTQPASPSPFVTDPAAPPG